jgi:hypothetical protein
MSYPDFRQPDDLRPARSQWWRHYVAEQGRRIAMNRMWWFTAFGAVAVLAAAIFLAPMLFAA